ncbi:MAG TPA: tRNA uracil 4-sulfurtransferase ThiI [Gemmatimonadales bacterium]|jgi:thiamine biosynthesis protein ThiI
MATVIVRLAPELTTKARRTRRRFQERLVRNLKDALEGADVPARIRPRWDRIVVESDDPTAGERAADVFGVSGVSLIEGRTEAALDAIVAAGRALYAERVRGRRFAVRARRSGKLSFGTHDVCVQLGAALNPGATVDLTNPEVTVWVELREGEAWFSSTRIGGVGGLPLGVEGRAVCLISGGFDSAVAAWLMLKRGVALDYVFCNLSGDAYERSVVSVAKVLADRWSFGDRPRMHVVEFGPVVDRLKARVTPRYWQVILKRLMYRAAEQVAQELDADAVITGESIGQVSSQTLQNLRAIDDVAMLPVFRPLIGMDKNEIIRHAQRIGTAPISATVREYCAILPDRPVTKCSPGAARREEGKLDLAPLAEAVAARRVVDLRALRAVDLVQPYLFVDDVPDGATVLDCRDAHHHDAWHYPGAQRWDLDRLAVGFRELDKTRTYVLCCQFGLLSAHMAEAMQRAGYEAYSFRGGMTALRRYAADRGGVPV